jgi:hypothetical protein
MKVKSPSGEKKGLMRVTIYCQLSRCFEKRKGTDKSFLASDKPERTFTTVRANDKNRHQIRVKEPRTKEVGSNNIHVSVSLSKEGKLQVNKSPLTSFSVIPTACNGGGATVKRDAAVAILDYDDGLLIDKARSGQEREGEKEQEHGKVVKMWSKRNYNYQNKWWIDS